MRGPRFPAITDPVFLLLGQEEALARMLLNPAVFEATVEHVFQITWEASRQYLETCGEHLDCYCIWEDFATQCGMMFAPKLWRRFFKPHYARLFDLAKAAGKYVWFHACGDITPVLPDLIDIGIDVWETVQLHVLPMTAQELKREYGQQITFFGGVNTQELPFLSPETVVDKVRHSIDCLGEGGGYICGPDHHIKPDVPAANVVALFDAVRTYARAGYTQQTGMGQPDPAGDVAARTA